MNKRANETCMAAIEKLRNASGDKEIEAAMQELLDNLPKLKRKTFADKIIELLAEEEQDSHRAWLITTLGEINAPRTTSTVEQFLNPKSANYDRLQYRALKALAKMHKPKDLEKCLKEVLTKTDNSRIKATALRLMIERELGDECVKELKKMIESSNSNETLAVCKALRYEEGFKPLPERAEKELMDILKQILDDENEWRDVRYQAAMALGDVTYKREDAILALNNALTKKDLSPLVRQSCIQSLGTIINKKTPFDEQQKRDTGQVLLDIIRQESPELRIKATKTLSELLKTKASIEFITDALLKEDRPPEEYIEALRQINDEFAAQSLSQKLLHPDPKIQKRASNALENLGGEYAFRTLHGMRTQVMKTYTQLLSEADNKIMGQFEDLMKKARFAFMISMGMHATIFLVGVGLIIASIMGARQAGSDWLKVLIGVGGTGGSLGTLLWLIYRDPIKNISTSVTNLVKVNIVFLGYMRQINQIDATFKQLFLNKKGFNTAQMEITVKQIQNSVEQTLKKVKVYMPDQDDEQPEKNNQSEKKLRNKVKVIQNELIGSQ